MSRKFLEVCGLKSFMIPINGSHYAWPWPFKHLQNLMQQCQIDRMRFISLMLERHAIVCGGLAIAFYHLNKRKDDVLFSQNFCTFHQHSKHKNKQMDKKLL